MKSIFSFVCMVGCFFSWSFAQENTQTYPYTVSTNNQSISTPPQPTVEDIDNELKAIDTKIAYVKAHPEELEIATKEKWFDQMEAYRKKLLEEKAALTNKQ